MDTIALQQLKNFWYSKILCKRNNSG